MPSFFRLRFLDGRDKYAVANALMGMLGSTGPKPDQPMMDWLRRTRQTPRAIERFWRPILVSALNEEPERCSARYAFKIFRDGFLAHPRAYEMGIPRVPLRELYDPCVEQLRRDGAEVAFRGVVRRIVIENGRVTGVQLDGETFPADYVVSAVSFDAISNLLPGADADPFFRRWSRMEGSPISGVHLWWDREVTDLGHAALLDRQIQWMFNKTQDFGRGQGGTYMGLVVSASRDWVRKSRGEILEIAEREVRESFPGTAGAKIVKSAIIKEARATYSAIPDIDELRPTTQTPIPNLFLAGDWVQNGWPSTMEAAVRSGYLAAEHVLAAESRPEKVLVPDLPWTAMVGKRA
jgi:zeta-carotene desaturase